jgi:hypothetical protein
MDRASNQNDVVQPESSGSGMAVHAEVKKATISAVVHRLQPDGTYKIEDHGVICEYYKNDGKFKRFFRELFRKIRNLKNRIKVY